MISLPSSICDSVALFPDGRTVISGSWDNTIRIWDAETGAPIGEPLREHSGGVWSVAFSQVGSRFVSGGDDGRIIVWDAATRKPIIGTGINPFEKLKGIKDGELDVSDCHYFDGWSVKDEWLLNESGWGRLWLSPSMRQLVKEVEGGLYVHYLLDFGNCNVTVEGKQGFIVDGNEEVLAI